MNFQKHIPLNSYSDKTGDLHCKCHIFYTYLIFNFIFKNTYMTVNSYIKIKR